MAKEHLLVEIPETIPEPYQGYMRQRNRGVGVVIAGILGLSELTGQNPSDRDDIYYVLARTLTADQARPRGIQEIGDMYGAVVEKIEHVGKAILHPSLDRKVPSFYSREFARAVEDVTLPGFSAFSYETAGVALQRLAEAGLKGRLKLPEESDGIGQFPVSNQAELQEILKKISAEDLNEKGVVLEADIRKPVTLSVGFVTLDSRQMSFLARQKSDIAPEDGRSRYKGAIAEIVRGDMENLGSEMSDPREKLAVEIGRKFYEAYSYFNPIASRISFDVLMGEDSRGRTLAGVTDITGRLGGTCPAIMEALKVFECRPEINKVKAEVTLNYQPEESLPEEKQAQIYVDTPTLRLTAKVLEV